MITYVAFLRGINVGGHKLIKMADLVRIFTKAGGREVHSSIHFVRLGDGRKYLGGAHEIQLPRGVERVGLVLDQFAPGLWRD